MTPPSTGSWYGTSPRTTISTARPSASTAACEWRRSSDASGPDTRDHYATLGVARDATTEEIRRAWVARARLLHPDAGGDDDDQVRAVNEAWHVLRDATRRLAHDRELGIDHGPRHSSRPWESPSADEERAVPLGEQVDAPLLHPSRPGDLLVLVPAGLVATAAVCFAVGTMMLNATLLVVAVSALLLGGVTFAIAPFLMLARDRRRSRR